MVLTGRNWGTWPTLWGICLLVLLAGWALFLAADMGADPPLGASDLEGQLLLGARDRMPGQDLPLGEWAPAVLLPLQTRIQALAFRTFGRELATARAVTGVGALLALAVLYLLILRASGPLTAFLTVLILAVNPVFFAVARTALPSVLSILFMLLVIRLWLAGARRPFFAYLSGAALVTVGLGENGPVNLFFLLAGFLMAVMLRLHAWKMAWFPATRRRLRFFWAGCVTALVPFVISVLTHWDQYGVMWRHFAGFSLPAMVTNLLRSPIAAGDLMQRMPLVVVVALVYFLFFAKDVIRPVARHRRLDEVRLWFLCWLLAGIPFFVFGFHTALHELVLLVPATCVLAAEGVTRLYALRRIERPKIDVMIVLILLASIAWFASAWAVRLLLIRITLPSVFEPHRLRTALAGTLVLWAGLTYVLGWLYLKWRQLSLLRLERLPVRSVAVVLLLGILGVGVASGGSWWSNRRHEVREAAAALAVLPADALVVGSWAPLLTLEKEARAAIIWPHVNAAPEPWHAEVTHLLLQEGRETDPLLAPLRLFEGRAGAPGLVREDLTLRIRGRAIRLYRVIRSE